LPAKAVQQLTNKTIKATARFKTGGTEAFVKCKSPETDFFLNCVLPEHGFKQPVLKIAVQKQTT
jgi:hypothetical protein